MVALNPLAEALNEELEAAAPELLAMLSELGKRAYFPKGILSQSAEAKEPERPEPKTPVPVNLFL